MKNLNTINANLNKDKDLQKRLKNLSSQYVTYSNEDFIRDSIRYKKAIKDGRIICNIAHVSKSGMSRNIKFLECNGSKNKGFNYLTFWGFFKMLGYSETNGNFKISGCGMDMIFYTNYSIIHTLFGYGFLSEKECDKLSQLTPCII